MTVGSWKRDCRFVQWPLIKGTKAQVFTTAHNYTRTVYRCNYSSCFATDTLLRMMFFFGLFLVWEMKQRILIHVNDAGGAVDGFPAVRFNIYTRILRISLRGPLIQHSESSRQQPSTAVLESVNPCSDLQGPHKGEPPRNQWLCLDTYWLTAIGCV